MTKATRERIKENVQVFKSKQVAIYMSEKDLERLDRLVELITPLQPNKSRVVQEALRFADLRIARFTKFINGQDIEGE